MKLLISIFALFCISSTSLQAQTDDQALPFSYVPQEILNEWKQWRLGDASPAVMELTQTFMNEYQVPQGGLYGLSLEDTWYWWISTNEAKVEIYISLMDKLAQQ